MLCSQKQTCFYVVFERIKKGRKKAVCCFSPSQRKKTREEGTERKKYQITFFRCGQISQNYFLFLSILAYQNKYQSYRIFSNTIHNVSYQRLICYCEELKKPVVIRLTFNGLIISILEYFESYFFSVTIAFLLAFLFTSTTTFLFRHNKVMSHDFIFCYFRFVSSSCYFLFECLNQLELRV